jgi:HAD superfamily hydrolase (TIGR01549 family)
MCTSHGQPREGPVGGSGLTGSLHTRTTAVVFDLDGTLLDTMTLAPTAYADTIRDLGGPAVSPGEVVAAWNIGSTAVLLAYFLGRSIVADDIECFYRHFEAAVEAARPFPGVMDMVDTLSRAGYRLGVFTSATRRATTLMLAAAGLDTFFPTVICGDEIGQPKPAPHGLRLACQYLGVTVAETTYVGDAEVDLRCAEAAGTVAIQACWHTRTTKVTAQHAVAEAPSDIVRLVGFQARN